uniref:Sema domain-containing protein n=1 Tax=Timema cristinae TaxID=61476 RepID=A0A7R9CAN3_TIMCR|nr:unnamed protein product [Timema cristinae]
MAGISVFEPLSTLLRVPNCLSIILHRIEWHSSGAHRELCYLKGKSEDDCQNYVRVLAKIAPNKLLICGTNAYKLALQALPLQREYTASCSRKPRALLRMAVDPPLHAHPLLPLPFPRFIWTASHTRPLIISRHITSVEV